jgi:glycosyltransferase involved in cell wall biosynthesis
MCENFIILYANNRNYVLGGVEVFNHNLEKSFVKNNILYKSIYKINFFKKNKFVRELFSVLKLIFSTNQKSTKYLLIHQSSFLEIIFLPIISVFFYDVRLLSHVGSSWKHISDKRLLGLTNFIVNRFVSKLYIISNDQDKFFNHKNKCKIVSIIDYDFYESKSLANNIDETYILYLGRICKEKGLTDLLYAYELLKQNYKTNSVPKLKLIGPVSESFKNNLYEIIDSLNLGREFVEILPPVYDIKQKIKLIDNSLFGVYPSYYDAFPLTPIEFFSRKKLCITTSISESKFFIEDEFLLFTPGDIRSLALKMSKLIKSEKKYLDNEKNKLTISKAANMAKGNIYKSFV